MGGPNFPPNLNITPSAFDGTTGDFDNAAQAEAIRQYGIAGRVWEAAYALNMYVRGAKDLDFDPPLFTPQDESRQRHILELGSGTGVVAAQLAERLAGRDSSLVVTDLPEVCPLLEKNLSRYISERNDSNPHVLVRPLSWGNEHHALGIYKELSALSRASVPSPCLSHIICSDLVYFPELLAPLLRTLLHLTSPPFMVSSSSSSSSSSYDDAPQSFSRITISCKIRSLAKETPFWSAFGLWFSFEPVLERQKRPTIHINRDDRDDTNIPEPTDRWKRFGSSFHGGIFIFVGHRRPESLQWEVPRNDDELLGGVGAWGSSSRKADDTFESLLLMGLGDDE